MEKSIFTNQKLTHKDKLIMNKKLFIVLCLALTNNVYCSAPQQKSSKELGETTPIQIPNQRKVALKTLVDEQLVPVLTAIVIAYLPLSEDIFEALLNNNVESATQFTTCPDFQVDTLCINNKTALYTAVEMQLKQPGTYNITLRIIPVLMEKGANPHLKVCMGRSPIDLISQAIEQLPPAPWQTRPTDIVKSRSSKTKDELVREKLKKLLATVSNKQSTWRCVIS